MFNNIDDADDEFIKTFSFSKKLGQNFLINDFIKNKIVDEVSTVFDFSNSKIIEIGPGSGAITTTLLKRGWTVLAIELDKKLCEFLNLKFSHYKNFILFNDDCLSFTLNDYVFPNDLIFSNTPYSITTSIIQKFICEWNPINAMFLTQKEVADRIISFKNSKKYSAFSVFCQTFLTIKKLFDVSANAFYPSPTISSSLLLLSKKKLNFNLDPFKYLQFLFDCFSMRRKTLLNNLKAKYNIHLIFEIMTELNINTNIRPQELDSTQFVDIYRKLFYEKNI